MNYIDKPRYPGDQPVLRINGLVRSIRCFVEQVTLTFPVSLDGRLGKPSRRRYGINQWYQGCDSISAAAYAKVVRQAYGIAAENRARAQMGGTNGDANDHVSSRR